MAATNSVGLGSSEPRIYIFTYKKKVAYSIVMVLAEEEAMELETNEI